MDNLSVHIANTSLKNDAKVLVIYSSPKKNGNTKKLLDAFVSNLPATVQIKTFSAYEIGAMPCTDCGFCKQNGACQFDDLNEFYSDFEQADLIVLATPVYNFSFPSPLKAIFDRFQRYFNAQFVRNEKPPIQKKRLAVILSTCGSDDDFGLEVIEHQAKRAFTVLNIEMFGKVVVKNMDVQGIQPQEMQKAGLLAKALF